jgi:hypothetical protein
MKCPRRPAFLCITNSMENQRSLDQKPAYYMSKSQREIWRNTYNQNRNRPSIRAVGPSMKRKPRIRNQSSPMSLHSSVKFEPSISNRRIPYVFPTSSFPALPLTYTVLGTMRLFWDYSRTAVLKQITDQMEYTKSTLFPAVIQIGKDMRNNTNFSQTLLISAILYICLGYHFLGGTILLFIIAYFRR